MSVVKAEGNRLNETGLNDQRLSGTRDARLGAFGRVARRKSR